MSGAAEADDYQDYIEQQQQRAATALPPATAIPTPEPAPIQAIPTGLGIDHARKVLADYRAKQAQAAVPPQFAPGSQPSDTVPEAPEDSRQSSIKDFGDTIWTGALEINKDIAGAASYANQKLGADPHIAAYLDERKSVFERHIQDTIAGMSAAGQRSMHASIFNDGSDPDNAPTWGQAGYVRTASAAIAGVIPQIALAVLPAGLMSKAAVKIASLAGAGADIAATATAPAIAGAATRIGQAVGTATTMGAFGTTDAGAAWNEIVKQVHEASPEEMAKSDAYQHLRDTGLSDTEARKELLNTPGLAANIAMHFGVGAVAGAGIGGLLTKGAMGAAGRGLAGRAAIGGAEGGVTLGAVGGADAALGQQAQQLLGTGPGFDASETAKAAASGFIGGVFLGGMGGALHGKPPDKPTKTPGANTPVVDPAIAAALTETLPTKQGELNLGTAPPGPNTGSTQGDMFRTIQQANPKSTGVPMESVPGAGLRNQRTGSQQDAAAWRPGGTPDEARESVGTVPLTGAPSGDPAPPLPSRAAGMAPNATQAPIEMRAPPPVADPRVGEAPGTQGEMFRDPGDITENGQQSNILVLAKQVRDAGGLQTRKAFDDFITKMTPLVSDRATGWEQRAVEAAREHIPPPKAVKAAKVSKAKAEPTQTVVSDTGQITQDILPSDPSARSAVAETAPEGRTSPGVVETATPADRTASAPVEPPGLPEPKPTVVKPEARTHEWGTGEDGATTLTVDGHVFRVVNSSTDGHLVATVPSTKAVVTVRTTPDALIKALKEKIAEGHEKVAPAKIGYEPPVETPAASVNEVKPEPKTEVVPVVSPVEPPPKVLTKSEQLKADAQAKRALQKAKLAEQSPKPIASGKAYVAPDAIKPEPKTIDTTGKDVGHHETSPTPAVRETTSTPPEAIAKIRDSAILAGRIAGLPDAHIKAWMEDIAHIVQGTHSEAEAHQAIATWGEERVPVAGGSKIQRPNVADTLMKLLSGKGNDTATRLKTGKGLKSRRALNEEIEEEASRDRSVYESEGVAREDITVRDAPASDTTAGGEKERSVQTTNTDRKLPDLEQKIREGMSVTEAEAHYGDAAVRGRKRTFASVVDYLTRRLSAPEGDKLHEPDPATREHIKQALDEHAKEVADPVGYALARDTARQEAAEAKARAQARAVSDEQAKADRAEAAANAAHDAEVKAKKDAENNTPEKKAARVAAYLESLKKPTVVETKPDTSVADQIAATKAAAKAAYDDAVKAAAETKPEQLRDTVSNPPQWAVDNARDLSGDVLYHDADVALIHGHGALDGKPVYIGVLADGRRTSVDISQYTGKNITPEQLARLREAKSRAVAADKAAHDARPNGPFEHTRVAGSRSVDPRLVKVAHDLTNMVGLGHIRVFLADPADMKNPRADETHGLHGPFAAIRSGSLQEGGGSVRRLANGDYHITLSPRVRISAQLETLAHEIGHILQREGFEKANATEKALIERAYGDFLVRTGNMKAGEYVRALRAHTVGKLTKSATPDAPIHLAPPYWRSFNEWFADQVSRWTTTDARPLSIVDKFFARIAEGYRKLVAAFGGDRWKADPVMRDWLNARGEHEAPAAPASPFQAWFGASKVVDGEGQPLRVYHGTGADIDVFSTAHIGTVTDAGFLGSGFYFGNADMAGRFAAKKMGGNVVPAFLRMENPLMLDDVPGRRPWVMIREALGLKLTSTADEVTRAAKAAGHDGVIFGAKGDPSEYVVFDPTQIKSAVSNTGDYSRNNPRIDRMAGDIHIRPTAPGAREGFTADAAERARTRSEGLPRDPELRAQAEPLHEQMLTSMGAIGDKMRNVIASRDSYGSGAMDKLRPGLLASSTTDAIHRWNRALFDKLKNFTFSNPMDRYRDTTEAIQHATKTFMDDFGDRANTLVKQAHTLSQPERETLGQLMNEATIANARLGGNLKTDANKHLGKPKQQAKLAGLQTRYNALTDSQKTLYEGLRDYYAETDKIERAAELKGVLSRAFPDATETQREAFAKTAANPEGLAKFLADPDNSEIAKVHGAEWSARRRLSVGLAKALEAGRTKGDYFPLARYGNYVVKYGDPKDKSTYGVERFESRADADTRYRELSAQGATDLDQVTVQDKTALRELMRNDPLANEIENAMRSDPKLKSYAGAVQDVINDILLKAHARNEVARVRRQGVTGASVDFTRTMARDFVNTASRVGHLEHGGERYKALSDMKLMARDLERNGQANEGIIARQVVEELERKATAQDDNAGFVAAASRAANTFGYVQSLMSFSNTMLNAVQVHMISVPLLGARHTTGRATLALSKAMAEIAPTLVRTGAVGTLKAMRKGLDAADWNLAHHARDKLIAANPAQAAGITKLFAALDRAGLIDHTQAAEMRRIANPSGPAVTRLAHGFQRFTDSMNISSHANDVLNKSVVAKASFDLEMRKSGGDVDKSVAYAIEVSRQVSPNYNLSNKARVATHKGFLGHAAAPIMQFKTYGLHMYGVMGNLVKSSIDGATKEERREAQKQFAGILATHALMAGSLTLIADPLRYIGGAYDFITGAEHPEDRQAHIRDWAADTFGPEFGQILARGLPQALGLDVHKRIGLDNMLSMPDWNTFTKKGAAEMFAAGVLGASGTDATAALEGFSRMMQGDVHGAIKGLAPRPVRDLMKAIGPGGLSESGVTDSTGKTILDPGRLSAFDIGAQAIGFQPSRVSEFREGREAVRVAVQDAKTEHAKLEQKWLKASGGDRADVMAEIRDFSRAHPSMKITVDQLMKLAQAAKKPAGPFGLKLNPAQAKEFGPKGAFANVQ